MLGRYRSGLMLARGMAALALGLFALPAASNPAGHVQRSVRLLQEGDLKGAEAAARLAVRDPATEAVAYALLGSIRLRQEKFAEGADLLELAVEADPSLVGARLNLAQAYALIGRNASSTEQLRAVLRLAPDNENARTALFRAESQAGNHREALELAKPIEPRLRASPDGLLHLARSYAEVGDTAGARSLVGDWSNLQGVPRDWTVKFALTLSGGGLNRVAIDILEELTKEGLASFDVAFNLGGLYLLESELEEASASYELALRFDDQSLPALRQVARIAEERGELEKALSFLIRAKLEAPEDPEVLFSFGRVALRLDLIEDATAALRKTLALSPEHRAARYWLGTAHGAARNLDAALEQYELLLEHRPTDPQLHYAVGSVHFLKVDFENATRHLRESCRLDPDQLLSPYYLASIAQKKGNNEEAIGMYAEIVARHPDHAPSYEGLAISQSRLRQYDEARRNFETAIRLDPDSARANYQLGQLLVRMGLREEAMKQLEVARDLREEEEESQIVKTLLNPH